MSPRSKLRAAAVLAVALGTGWYVSHGQLARQNGGAADSTSPPSSVTPAPQGYRSGEQDAAQAAFQARSRNRIIAVNGQVERILADDRDGSPHQRFIIRTGGGISLLVAHNLDLAPRLEGLARGDSVAVLGEYEWNAQGGVMHWTHDDPQGRHPAGYIEWRGRRYQ